jgi:hypothetical protein
MSGLPRAALVYVLMHQELDTPHGSGMTQVLYGRAAKKTPHVCMLVHTHVWGEFSRNMQCSIEHQDHIESQRP